MGCGQSVPTKAAYDYARKGDVVALRPLLERHEHADYVRVRNLVNFCDPQGLTPLLAACKHPKCTLAVPIVKALIDAGADVAATDVNGNNALHMLLAQRRTHGADQAEAAAALVRLLVRQGCPSGAIDDATGCMDPAARNVHGNTPLAAAVAARSGRAASAGFAPAIRALELDVALGSGWLHELKSNFVSRSLGRVAGLGAGSLSDKLCTWERRYFVLLPAPRPIAVRPGALPDDSALELRLYNGSTSLKPVRVLSLRGMRVIDRFAEVRSGSGSAGTYAHRVAIAAADANKSASKKTKSGLGLGTSRLASLHGMPEGTKERVFAFDSAEERAQAAHLFNTVAAREARLLADEAQAQRRRQGSLEAFAGGGASVLGAATAAPALAPQSQPTVPVLPIVAPDPPMATAVDQVEPSAPPMALPVSAPVFEQKAQQEPPPLPPRTQTPAEAESVQHQDPDADQDAHQDADQEQGQEREQESQDEALRNVDELELDLPVAPADDLPDSRPAESSMLAAC